MARAAARQISFADVELMRQGVRLEPLLEAISKFLDSQHEMIERVRRDLVRGLKKPGNGRRGLTAPQVLRSLVVMRVKDGAGLRVDTTVVETNTHHPTDNNTLLWDVYTSSRA